MSCHVVRYEDMHANPQRTFARAARLAGLDHSRQEIDKAIEFSRVDVLQGQEDAVGFREKPTGMPQFFREGRVGSWRKAMSPEQVGRIIQDHGEVMRRFGYLDAEGEPLF